MMYKPLTHHTDLGDVEIIEHEGQLHLFHLIVPNRDVVGHAVSDDGLHWKALSPAIYTGGPEDYDGDMIRTVSVTKHNQQFYMLYTSTSGRRMANGISEGGRVERFGVAVSKDLFIWEKRRDVPFVEANGKFYEDQFGVAKVVSFRDPKPYFENGTYYCVIAARENQGPFLRRGCAALYTSQDLITWEAQAPLFAPRSNYDIECPQIYKLGKYYYLLGSVIEDASQRYWVSEQLEGPYRTPANNKLMPSGSHYAARVGMFNKQHILCCWNRSIEDGSSPFGLISNIGSTIKYVPSPLLLNQADDGTLSLAPFKGWDRYSSGTPELIDFAEKATNRFDNKFSAFDHDQNCLKVISGMDGIATENHYSDFMLEGEIFMEASRGGLSFHMQNDTTGYFIELHPYEQKVRLVKHFSAQKSDRTTSFSYEVKQENTVVFLNSRQAGLPFMLRVVGGEIEFSIRDCVLLSTVSTKATSGSVGMFVESGDIRVHNFRLTRMKNPT